MHPNIGHSSVSGGISVSRGSQYRQYSPTSTNFTVFSKSQNARKAGTLCMYHLRNNLTISATFYKLGIIFNHEMVLKVYLYQSF